MTLTRTRTLDLTPPDLNLDRGVVVVPIVVVCRKKEEVVEVVVEVVNGGMRGAWRSAFWTSFTGRVAAFPAFHAMLKSGPREFQTCNQSINPSIHQLTNQSINPPSHFEQIIIGLD